MEDVVTTLLPSLDVTVSVTTVYSRTTDLTNLPVAVDVTFRDVVGQPPDVLAPSFFAIAPDTDYLAYRLLGVAGPQLPSGITGIPVEEPGGSGGTHRFYADSVFPPILDYQTRR